MGHPDSGRPTPDDAFAVATVRLWREGAQVRARVLRYSGGDDAAEATSAIVTADPYAALAAIGEFIDDFLATSSPPSSSSYEGD